MKFTEAAFFTGRHLFAAACSAVFVAAGPVIAYGVLVVVGVAFYGDMGGPLNFIIVPVLSVFLGVATTLLVYVPLCLGFEFWRRRSRMPVWLPPLPFFAGCLLFFSALFLRVPPPPFVHMGVAFALAAFFTVGFSIYWLVSSFSDMIVSWFRKSPTIRARRTAAPVLRSMKGGS
jgi:hypothetical protein